MQDGTTQDGVTRWGTRWRLPLVVVLAFAVSATATTIVGAAVGGSATSFVGDGARNSVIGGDGADTMVGAGGDDFFQGMLGADTLSGDADDDTLIGDPGLVSFADVLDGGDGNDELAGAGGGDTIRGGAGNDFLGSLDFTRAGGVPTTEYGNDQLFAGPGDDMVFGGPGNDVVLGEDGSDHLEGGEGDDLLDGATGPDTLNGESGADLLRTTATDAADTLNGGPGNDRVEARNGVADTVDCGEEEGGAADSDVAVLDRADTAVNCETVEYPATTPPSTPPPSTPADTTAPDTRIASGPPKVIKTSKRKVKATFVFDASEAGSTFLCSVDGAPFTPCGSPRVVSLGIGRHVFKVQARDAAGNLDGSPASWPVKVAKKRGRG